MRQGLEEVRALGDRAALLARSAAPLHRASAEALHEAYTAALRRPEAFARGGSPAESRDLVERSVRAELAVALAVSERVAARELEHARLLVDHLPCTRAALAEARLRWEAGQIICGVAASLPPATLPEFDERAAGLAASMTPTQLRRRLARLRDELHESPLADRHARAREDRSVRVSPEQDGMATLCATLPARQRSVRSRGSTGSPAPSAAGAVQRRSARSRSCGPTPWSTCSATATCPARRRATSVRARPLAASGPRCV
ncbi:DUF222 domain-containing protein [Rathayibacter sp. AY1D5]|uniref:DUF222 domain-containing protein n=1 Tax=Rathayibacter sp. AY1D5 TaxID=2080546 RepID=UPI0015E445FC|nr:DUF222 domain-containing protein [Rathayibacter sp. AY1D5]